MTNETTFSTICQPSSGLPAWPAGSGGEVPLAGKPQNVDTTEEGDDLEGRLPEEPSR